MSFCFANSVDALGEPDFKAPIVEAMQDASDCFLLFKHFPLLQSVVSLLPGSLAAMILPQSLGIARIKRILSKQIKHLVADPSNLKTFSHPIIFQKLLDPEASNKSKARKALNERNFLQEAQSLLFNGCDPVSNQIMLGTWSLLENPGNARKLKNELLEAWPALDKIPTFEELEKLPYLVISCAQF